MNEAASNGERAINNNTLPKAPENVSRALEHGAADNMSSSDAWSSPPGGDLAVSPELDFEAQLFDGNLASLRRATGKGARDGRGRRSS